VIIADIDSGLATGAAAEINALGGNAVPYVIDIQESKAIDSFREAMQSEYGRVDILVNNVGHWVSIRGSFVDEDDDLWDRLYQINLLHVFRTTHAFLRHMIERGSGSIINVSSIEGTRGYPNQPVYAAFKAAVIQFTRSLGVQVAAQGVRVNGIAPDLTRSIQCDHPRVVGPDRIDQWPRWTPIGREGMPDDQADVILFLATDASRYLVGHTIPTDGGTGAAAGWHRSARPLPAGQFTNFPFEP
jgi:NAD(P)-dependent dehydrogenase (short-subunit alcohol dehydrogenase family)